MSSLTVFVLNMMIYTLTVYTGLRLLKSGRPFDGCGIFVTRKYKLYSTPVETYSQRVFARLDIFGINVYFICEIDGDSHEEFSLQLSAVNDIIERFSGCKVICSGDFYVVDLIENGFIIAF